MPNVPGLRSPYIKVGRLVYFGRMIDKLRLHAAGRLPADYVGNIAKGFDGRCCAFLRINHEELKTHVLANPSLSDEAALAWAESRGGARTDEECEVWNGFMMKRGWRDAVSEMVAKRIKESGLEGKPIFTMFECLDFDEGRDPSATRPWES